MYRATGDHLLERELLGGDDVPGRAGGLGDEGPLAEHARGPMRRPRGHRAGGGKRAPAHVTARSDGPGPLRAR
eukprot:2912753-Prorocentrum_lima.AAC.1